jgi:outer membrane biosynthesis protein TonB
MSKKAVLASLIIHLLVGIMLYRGVAFDSDIILKEREPRTITIDMVTVKTKSNIATQTEKPKAKKLVEKAVKAKPKPTKKKQEQVKRPEKSKKKVEHKAKPEPKKAPVKKTAKQKLPKPEKPKPRPKPKKEETKDIFNEKVLKSLKEEEKKREEVKKDFDNIAQSIQAKSEEKAEENQPLSVSQKNYIKNKISYHWKTTSFSGSAKEGLQAVLSITLDDKGNVLDVRLKSQKHSDPFFISFLDSAIRAVKRSSPLDKLPREKFNTWKEIEMTFDSSGMVY